MSKALEQEVRRRAEFRCEYCRLPQSFTRLQFVMDHIIAQQHGGGPDLENLALCCQHYLGGSDRFPIGVAIESSIKGRQEVQGGGYRFGGRTNGSFGLRGYGSVAVLTGVHRDDAEYDAGCRS